MNVTDLAFVTFSGIPATAFEPKARKTAETEKMNTAKKNLACGTGLNTVYAPGTILSYTLQRVVTAHGFLIG